MSRHYSLVLETRQVHNHPMTYEKRRNGKSRHPTTQKVTYTPGELARLLGIARNGVYSALRNGKIPHIRIGRRFVIPCTAVDAWLASPGDSRPEHTRSGAV
jgi:excisionase family DNA binding protein